MNVDDFTADRKLAKNKIARDGEVVRVPLMLMDSAGVDPGALAALRSMKDTGPQIMHRPGPVGMNDSARILRDGARSERDERIKRLNDAWRPASQERKAPPRIDARPDPMQALADRNAAMSERWKGGR